MASSRTYEWGTGEHVGSLFDVPEEVHSTDKRTASVDVAALNQARSLVRQSGVVETLVQWREEDGADPRRGGRPKIVSDEQVVTLLMLLMLDNSPMHLTRACDLVCHRLTKRAYEALGLPRDTKLRSVWYFRLWRAFRRVLAPIDPYRGQQYHRRYTKEEWAQILDARDPETIALITSRLHHFTNRLVWASVMAMPEKYRSRWDGTICVDGTPLTATWRGTAKRATRVSSEPDAGWYRRDGDHLGAEGKDALDWAWEATLVTMASPVRGDDAFPKLLVGFSLGRPGVAPREQAMAALQNLANGDVPRGYAVGDKLYYPGSKPETWQEPVRRLGYRLIGDQIKGQTGVQGTHEGARLVDGNWYCPAMPKPLVEATTDYDADRIDATTYAQRLSRRAAYVLREKEAPRADGSVRYKCPALGPGATCECPLRRREVDPSKGRRVKILDVPEEPRGVCTKASLTVPLSAAPKYAQQGPQWNTEAWHEAYNSPRQTIESHNRFLKDSSGMQLGDHSRRLVRGFAAQAFIAALAVVADNVRVLKSFLTRPERSQDDEPTPPRPPRRRPGRRTALSDLLATNPSNGPGEVAA
jgi:hypothetical protein